MTADRGDLFVELGEATHALSRREAVRLRRALDDALAEEREFVHTVGVHRPDGSYVVERRGADSSGHRKVFDSFGALRELYGRLPDPFTAADVEAGGLSGGRRHMVVRHLAEHPAFDCSLVRHQPLTVRRHEGGEPPD